MLKGQSYPLSLVFHFQQLVFVQTCLFDSLERMQFVFLCIGVECMSVIWLATNLCLSYGKNIYIYVYIYKLGSLAFSERFV